MPTQSFDRIYCVSLRSAFSFAILRAHLRLPAPRIDVQSGNRNTPNPFPEFPIITPDRFLPPSDDPLTPLAAADAFQP